MKLTSEYILSLEAGREMDRLVGLHVMNLDIVDDTLPQLPKYYLPEYERTIFRDVPLYSSEISASWEVVEKIKQELQDVTIHDDPYSGVTVAISLISVVKDKTVPLAICKAALIGTL